MRIKISHEMVITCAVNGCTNRQQKGSNISYHSFPKDEVLLNKWLVAIERLNFSPSKYSKLCSQHFQNEEFDFQFGLKKLKFGVVPSIFHISKKNLIARANRLRASGVHNKKGVKSTIINSKSYTDKSVETKKNDPVRLKEIELSRGTVPQKRKGRPPLCIGNISPEDLPKAEQKNIWKIAKHTINQQKKIITYLRKKVHYLESQVHTLNDSVKDLRKEDNISSHYYSIPY